ncbi:MAG: PD-(D/E)XK motif protein [Hymenobacter sp.]|nr:MAG: PD-(D/E)XK motif protein [Hymenobacter sp.]
MKKNLAILFEELTASNSPHICALPIPWSIPHRLARYPSGEAALFIAVDQNTNYPPSETEYLTISHGVGAEISTEDNSNKSYFSIIKCKSIDFIPTFLNVSTFFIDEIGVYSTPKYVVDKVQQLAELFKALQSPPKKSIQGLWAELIVIYCSDKCSTLVEAWRGSDSERYDFSLNDERLEVKSTDGQTRSHYFSLPQIRPGSAIKIVIASLFVNPSANGLSLRELKERILLKIANEPSLCFKVDKVVFDTLGSAYEVGLSTKYDFNEAVSSLMFYSAEEIPSVSPLLPNTVTEVRFKADLTSCTVIDSLETYSIL